MLGEGDDSAARASFRDAIEKDERDWVLWFDLARASEGRLQRRALRKASRLNPLSLEIADFRTELRRRRVGRRSASTRAKKERRSPDLPAHTPAQDQLGRDRPAICHRREETLFLPEPALRSHLRHGDRLGWCDASPPIRTLVSIRPEAGARSPRAERHSLRSSAERGGRRPVVPVAGSEALGHTRRIRGQFP